MNAVAVLCVRKRSVYESFPGLELYDVGRDCRTFLGGSRVVAHPPCRGWGRLKGMAKPRPDEKDLARFCVEKVRACGGVLEHPANSSLWDAASLPAPGCRDSSGAFTLSLDQFWFGHRGIKRTWLFVAGVSPFDVPEIPLRLESAAVPVENMSCAERESTPPLFAAFLLDLARRSSP